MLAEAVLGRPRTGGPTGHHQGRKPSRAASRPPRGVGCRCRRRYAPRAVISPDLIRNFSIISHVDHGKSTLSDRILELTHAVDPRLMREQYLDSMDLERERGITIKAQNVRVNFKGHVLHLIDTPGHVDFGYEVSRSLAACEGAVLLVDASQGIQAQTLATCYQAIENDLEIVAALNKIDLPAAEPDKYAAEIERVLGIPAESILRISAKTGSGVDELLDAVVARVPSPEGSPDRRVAGPHLRLVLRPVPGRGELDPGHGRRPAGHGQDPVHAGRLRPGRGGDRVPHARPHAGRRARAGRGGLSDRRDQGRGPGPLGGDGDRRRPSRPRAAGRVPRPQADGVLRAVPDRRRRTDGPARSAREAAPQRLELHVRARVLGGPRVRVPVRVPGPVAHGDRARAPRARVRPVAHRHGAIGGLRGPAHRRHRGPLREPQRDARRQPARPHRRAHAAHHHHRALGVHRHASWICARRAEASSTAWSTCRPSASSSSTGSPWPRSSSTSSTS